jgi:hypothetical protein
MILIGSKEHVLNKGNLIKFRTIHGFRPLKIGVILNFIDRTCQYPIIVVLQDNGKIYQYVNTLFIELETIQ